MSCNTLTLLPYSGSVESNTEIQVSGKVKIALLRKLAILGRRWPPIFKNQVQTPQAVLRDYTGKRWTGEEVNHYIFRNGALMSYFWLEYNLSRKSLVSYYWRIWHNGKAYRITNLQSQYASVVSSVNGELWWGAKGL